MSAAASCNELVASASTFVTRARSELHLLSLFQGNPQFYQGTALGLVLGDKML